MNQANIAPFNRNSHRSLILDRTVKDLKCETRIRKIQDPEEISDQWMRILDSGFWIRDSDSGFGLFLYNANKKETSNQWRGLVNGLSKKKNAGCNRCTFHSVPDVRPNKDLSN